MADQLQNNNVSQIIKGLHRDNSFLDMPKGAYYFALNSVNETELGDYGFISNEEGNEICGSLTPGFSPIGKIYISNNRFVIFSVSNDDAISEIGILDNNCNYTPIVNDETADGNDKLGFSLSYQIQGTYRLRKGCEDTVYWVDGLNPVRYFNFHKINAFKNSAGLWDSNKFKLFRTASTFPEVGGIEILEGQGTLTPGNYSILVQYLDEDFNGTQFLEIVSNIHIYNDNLENPYYNINGSSAIEIGEGGAYKYEDTNKAISINLANLDEDFPYVRFAFVEFTTGRGSVTKVKYTDVTNRANPSFIYTGVNAIEEGTIEDVQFEGIGAGIEVANHIEQIENRLLLANTKGSSAKLTLLQKYASKITADCVVKQTILTNIKDSHNTKNPLVTYNGVGYQPGEVYSLGIVYLFDDFTYSPVLHIPGKSSEVSNQVVYSPGPNVYPMSNRNNINISETYLDNVSCSSQNYWGRDSEGTKLENKFVRHHRFPTRKELGLPLVTKDSDIVDTTFNMLNLLIDGSPKQSVTCDEDEAGCTPYTAPKFSLIVRYKVDGEDAEISSYVNPDGSFVRNVYSTLYTTSQNITDIKLFYLEEKNDPVQEVQVEIPLTGGSSTEQANGLTYRVLTVNTTQKDGVPTYYGYVFGLKFSNIEIPSEEEIGKKVIGYQIVRQERKDSDKTILDSGVLFPMLKNENFESTSLLNPELEATGPYAYDKKVSKNSVALLAPWHKFADKSFDNFTEIEQVGEFKSKNITYNAFMTQDIMEGSTADDINTTGSTDDNDGYSLKHSIRYTEVEYGNTSDNISITKDGTRIYSLDALSHAESTSGKEILYNLACDNKILVLNREAGDITAFQNTGNKFPYVYIKKNHNTFYQNFRNAVFYTTSDEMFTEDTCVVYGGDTYISPLRYSNHIFLNAVGAIRKEKQSFLKVLGAILAVVVAVIATIVAPPAGIALTATLVGAGLLAIGGIALGAAAIVENAKFLDVYVDKWKQGLDKSTYDTIVHRQFIDPNINKSEQLWYRDDTFNWFGDVVGDLWFESTLNMSLRVPPRTHSNNFLQPLRPPMSDYKYKFDAVGRIYHGSRPAGHRYIDEEHSAEGDVAQFFFNKLLSPDSSKNSKYAYNGVSLPIVYVQNMDFNVTTKVKPYYPLSITYDGCSDCSEKFPHRIYYSEQSFQEEKTDNYRTFLPNNYRDIEGETGEITNIFRFYNNLYIHTEEALWMLPRNYQERVTDQVVSFIGTGSYFEIPPQKIIDDDNGSSAGTRHKWSGIKTPAGYFFVCENQRKVYQFDGKQLKPISSQGLETWFEKNLEVKFDKEYLELKGIEYPSRDNPVNILGTGFHTTYDSIKERILFTKKDYSNFNSILRTTDYELCIKNGKITMFPDITNTIVEQANLGWNYSGIEDCRLKFFKEVIKYREETRQITTTVVIPPDAIIIPFFDTTSMTAATITNLSNTIDTWFTGFKETINGGDNGLILMNPGTWNRWGSEDWLDVPQIVINNLGQNLEVLLLVFVDESNGPGTYHSGTLTNPMSAPTSGYVTDVNNFVNVAYPKFKSFRAINYPIQRTTEEVKEYLQHTIACIEARDMTQSEVDALKKNANFSSIEWDIVKNNLKNNPYKGQPILKDYGWLYKEDRVDGIDNNLTPECPQTGYVISPCVFTKDVQDLLESATQEVIEEVVVQVPYVEYEYMYLDGQELSTDSIINNSWTLSYSLKNNSWVSWHSYLPSMYLNTPNKFYSWRQGNSNFWRHGVKGLYQTFYGKYYPHILEYVSLSNPLTTRDFNTINLQTTVKDYHTDLEDYSEDLLTTFNKAVLYNSRQCSGEIELIPKDRELQDEDYMMSQVVNTNSNRSIIDRTEKDWYINDFRDLRVNYNRPIWIQEISQLQENYFIDKILNTETIDVNKDWTQLENFKDKYLVIRLIFDNFANKKIITNYSVENEQVSLH